ncbi:MAG: hypothetical protein ACOZEN_16075 [Thermodesulfobacteriota bacterium]
MQLFMAFLLCAVCVASDAEVFAQSLKDKNSYASSGQLIKILEQNSRSISTRHADLSVLITDIKSNPSGKKTFEAKYGKPNCDEGAYCIKFNGHYYIIHIGDKGPTINLVLVCADEAL